MAKILYDGFHKIEEVRTQVKGKEVVREKLIVPSAVAGVVLSRNGLVALVRQYRPAIEAYTYELPAGILDKGLSPQETLIEEIMEECNITNRHSINVLDRPHAQYYINIGSTDATVQVYRAFVSMDVTPGEFPVQNDNDVETVRWVEVNEFIDMFSQGLIVDPKTIIGFYDMYTTALELNLKNQ